jgi:glutaredoxin
MKKVWIAAIIIIIIVIAVAGFSATGFFVSDNQNSFAKCLSEKGAVMYGTDWCGYCKKQKELFGSSFSDIVFIDCDYNKADCDYAGVTGYPTWRINGVNYPGLQSLEKLANLTGCNF